AFETVRRTLQLFFSDQKSGEVKIHIEDILPRQSV
ncbi:MAG: NUDIX hydrolase, partial [Gammaproteobacteria bacterium]|nr:NUDIX hydrolase [Gammaproteobacteria bacterium]